MQLTNAEKLLVLVQASCLPNKRDHFVDVEKVASWVHRGQEWAIHWEYDCFEPEAHPLDPVVNETESILAMFRRLQSTSDEELADAGLSRGDVSFKGFDANTDAHYHVACVLVDELKRFEDVRGATLNSHSIGSLPRYREMLIKFNEACKQQPPYSVVLTSQDLKRILE